MGEQYQPGIPLPGVRFAGQMRGGWARAFGAWRPDRRTVGLLLVAMHVGAVASRLFTVDLAWTGFVAAVGGSTASPFGIPWQQAVGATTYLLSLPVEALLLGGAIALVLRRGGGLWVAAGALAGLFAIELVDAAVYLVSAHGSIELRSAIGHLLTPLGAGLPLAVLLWSRPAAEDG
jgi:hypothetical protein